MVVQSESSRDGLFDVKGRREIGAKAQQYCGFQTIGLIWYRAGQTLLGNLSKGKSAQKV